MHGYLVYFGYQSQIWDDLDATFVGSQGAANAIVWLTSPFFIVKVTNSALGTQLLVCSSFLLFLFSLFLTILMFPTLSVLLQPNLKET